MRQAAAPLPAAAPRASSWKPDASAQAALLATLDRGQYVEFDAREGAFALVARGAAAPLVVSAQDFPGVVRAVHDLEQDIGRVTGLVPAMATVVPATDQVVLVGTLGKSPPLDGLVASGKLDAAAIAGRWETHLTTVVEAPFPGVRRALVIAGSDQRGTIYGVYDLCAQMGVSPWAFWDDVPPARHEALYVRRGRFSQGEPAVKYRGFFINDENPQLARWARATFGPAPNPDHPNGFHQGLYAHVYEVLLRLRGNYLWPAVWGRSLFDDDPRNQSLAAEYGIVMGTSHEAPLMRAQDEWNRYGQPDGPYGGNGAFSFVRNQTAIEKYWIDGLKRMNGYESLVTIGMRGNGDTGMEDAAGTELMGRIVATQRHLIQQVTGQDPRQVPQVWTLYKEVQEYWAAGMRAPDDVTVIWCDDNWGNLRGLPDLAEPMRSGGYGLYYHFDYVGGARNYKWVDTTLLPNLWEQLHLARWYGVDRVWMVNVGDLKNNEHPLEYFLDYAWDPERLPIERLHAWEVQWARENFGAAWAESIAEVLEEYGNLQSRRKPELLNRAVSLDPRFELSQQDEQERAIVYSDGSPFSLINYREAELVVEQWRGLLAKADAIRQRLPRSHQDAYYELVYYAVAATANVYELRFAQFKNLLYAQQLRAATNDLAEVAERRFAADQAMSRYYDTELAHGKWVDWQTQPKLAYGGPYPNSQWQQPERDNRATKDFIWPQPVRIHLPEPAELAVAIDGSSDVWPGAAGHPVLPEFSPYQTQPAQYIEVINRGQTPFDFEIESRAPWLTATPREGTVQRQVRVELAVDWDGAPQGRTETAVVVRQRGGGEVEVGSVVHHPVPSRRYGFVESNGVISFEADHFERIVGGEPLTWKRIPDIGRTGGGITPFPVTAPRQAIGAGPRVEYEFTSFSRGPVTVWTYLSPRNNVIPSDGLQYAISIDQESPQVVNVTTALNAVPMNRSWERNTSDNVARVATAHVLARAGRHVLKVWMVDPTVVVQKLIVDTGGMKESYLGPPESYRVEAVP